jgi:hypothetical protein
LIIEDQSGRSALGGEIAALASRLVSGVGVAVRGTCENGVFLVSQHLFDHFCDSFFVCFSTQVKDFVFVNNITTVEPNKEIG